uniref:Rhodanese domain-containing protein n=1 Tax=Schistosoma haematobium TaxID=6185 RepID=A0A095A4K7_SCHHA
MFHLSIVFQQNSLHHYDFWTLNNSLHSPWPSIEVDQLANWLIEMKSMILKKSPIFQKSVCTLSYSFSSNSSSSSCCSSCSSCSCSSSCSSSSSSSSEVFGPNEEQLSGKGNKRSKCCLHHLRYKHKLQNQQKMITLSKLKMNPEHFVIIDCRYPHEYNAGHIFSAINLSDWPKLYKYFFGIKQQSIETTEMDLSNSLYSTEQLIEPKPSHTIFILYCEFSTKQYYISLHILH